MIGNVLEIIYMYFGGHWIVCDEIKVGVVESTPALWPYTNTPPPVGLRKEEWVGGDITWPRSGAPVPPTPGMGDSNSKMAFYICREAVRFYILHDTWRWYDLVLAHSGFKLSWDIFSWDTSKQPNVYLFSSKCCLSIQLILILHVFIKCFIQNRKY